MSEAEAPIILPVGSVKSILAATGRSGPFPPDLMDALGRWLSDGLERAIHRGHARPLTMADVNKLDRAYVRFRDTIQALQDRRSAPPLMSVKDCQTEWEYWVATHRALGLKPGRPESVDWHLVGELIAFYETVSKRRASGSQPHGPTMRFLDTALSELAKHAPSAMGSRFRSPNSGALRQQLGALRSGYFRFVGQELSSLFDDLRGSNAGETEPI